MSTPFVGKIERPADIRVRELGHGLRPHVKDHLIESFLEDRLETAIGMGVEGEGPAGGRLHPLARIILPMKVNTSGDGSERLKLLVV